MDSFVVNVLVHDVLDLNFEFELNWEVVMEEVHHFDSIDLVVVNNTVDHEAAVAEEVVDDHNWMVDMNVEVVVEIEEEVAHLDDENLDVGKMDVEMNVEKDDLHKDIAAVVDYQSDETDVDAVAVDRVVVEGVDNTAADHPDCNNDLAVDNVHWTVHHADAVETATVLDK